VDQERMSPADDSSGWHLCFSVPFTASTLLVRCQEGYLARKTTCVSCLQSSCCGRIKEAYLYSAYYELLISRCSGVACVNEG